MDDELNSEEEKDVRNDDNKSAISSDLIRGHINTIILRTLYERDKYGYEIIEEIEAKSHGQYSLKQPTLYSALKRLESQGYINAYWKTEEVSNGGRRKYYTLTDSGREITEKNQSEWEYSRTVIDSLISDKNFDFTQPPPAPVDFKILKTSTSRVPNVKDSEDDKGEEPLREVKYEEPVTEKQPEQKTEEKPAENIQQPTEQPIAQPEAQTVQQIQYVEQPPIQQIVQPVQSVQVQYVEQPAQPIVPTAERINEEKRIHENYLKLISEPVAAADETPTNPYSERINTESLIYNKKPETERDYKNLIDNLFVRTVQHRTVQPAPAPVQQTEVKTTVVHYDDANTKASNDGLKVNSQDYVVSSSFKHKYNRGSALFKSSLIIAVIMLVEFALSLAFMNELKIGISYPIVIATLAVAQLLIFGVIKTTSFGKSARKPVTLTYLTTSIVLGIIAVLIVFVVSLILNVNFADIGDISAKIIIPAVVALNIPIFSAIFYLFSK